MLVVLCKLLCKHLGSPDVQATEKDGKSSQTHRKRRPRLPAAISDLVWRLDHEDADDAAQATSGLRLLNALIRKRALFARWKQCAEERGNKAGSRSPHRKRIGPVAHAEQEEQTCVKLSARVETLQKQLSEANDAIESLQKEKRTRFEHLWQKAVEVGQEQLASFLEKHELERTILLHRIRFLESVGGEDAKATGMG
uniref:Uncharacterized protein n=1 Tax=Hanusia phi TaxID=3032 RepID=A0A6T7MGH4_9CRYP|mmetsp:Transcript_11962/g.27624  ORF Transcript_11962/g.27624 Transcript_11962/m.27624 type:complete len:197 (+) Transcript_11962:87-677(+)